MKSKKIGKFVGNRIREERKKLKMTQKDLGLKIGVQPNTVSSYETGVNEPDQEMIFKIARALSVTVDELFPDHEDFNKDKNLEKALNMANNLPLKDMEFLNKLIQKTLSMEDQEREKFLESIKFTVEYYERNKDN